MSPNFWKVPAWNVPVDQAVRVELLRLTHKTITPESGWPESFWKHVQERHSFENSEAQHIIQLFQELSLGEPARCHMPPWGLAFYDEENLLFTTTLCFECSNAYVHTVTGTNLRAFDAFKPRAKELLALLKQKLPL